MKSIAKWVITYIIYSFVSAISGFHYNLFYSEFNLLYFIIVIAIWVTAISVVEFILKLFDKQKKASR